MLPSLRQRLIIAAAIALATVGFLSVLGKLRPTDGSTGLSLMTAHVGLATAAFLVALAGLPAAVVGAVASATGHPMAGIFASTVALTVLAGAGGSMDQWLWHATLPNDYQRLLLELAIWQAGLVAMLIVVQTLRSPLRTNLPMLAFSDHLGMDTSVRFPQLEALAAGLTSAFIGGGLCWLLIRSTQVGQIIGAMILAFALAGLIAQLLFTQTNPIGILLSPAVVAAVSYAYVLYNFQGRGPDRVLEAWYTGKMPGTALALPIFYASAAIAGCTIGIGAAQALHSDPETPNAAKS